MGVSINFYSLWIRSYSLFFSVLLSSLPFRFVFLLYVLQEHYWELKWTMLSWQSFSVIRLSLKHLTCTSMDIKHVWVPNYPGVLRNRFGGWANDLILKLFSSWRCTCTSLAQPRRPKERLEVKSCLNHHILWTISSYYLGSLTFRKSTAFIIISKAALMVSSSIMDSQTWIILLNFQVFLFQINISKRKTLILLRRRVFRVVALA